MIPYSLKEISKEKALSIINKHKEGYWEYAPFNSDFVYEGKDTKYGKRYEMIRANNICGRVTFEWGICSM